MSTIPNICILAPKNVVEAQFAIDYALTLDKPVVIRYSKYDRNYHLNPNNDFMSWDVIQNGDIAIVSYGDLLAEIYPLIKDTNIGLINAKNISIIDQDVLGNYKKVIVIEEVVKNSCLGEKIISYVYHNKLNVEVETYNLGMTYLETGSKKELINKYIGNLETIIRKEIKC